MVAKMNGLSAERESKEKDRNIVSEITIMIIGHRWPGSELRTGYKGRIDENIVLTWVAVAR